MATKEISSEEAILEAYRDSEEAIEKARQVEGYVGQAAASKVWMGT